MLPENEKRIEAKFQAPQSVQLVVERSCQLQCQFCDQPSSKEQLFKATFPESDKPEDLEKFWEQKGKELERLGLIIDRLAEWGVSKITLTGGEPTLMPGIEEILKHAKAQGIKTALATNGVATYWPPRKWSTKEGGILTPSLLGRIASVLDVLKVPLHSSQPENHDSLVGLQGSFAAILLNLNERCLYYSSDFAAEVTCVVNTENLNEISQIVDICLNFSVSQLTLSEVYPRGRGRNFTQLVSWEKIEQIRQKLLAERGAEIAQAGLNIVVRQPTLSCVLVYPEGDIFVSHWMELGLYPLGNLLKENVNEIWKKLPLREEYNRNYLHLNQ